MSITPRVFCSTFTAICTSTKHQHRTSLALPSRGQEGKLFEDGASNNEARGESVRRNGVTAYSESVSHVFHT